MLEINFTIVLFAISFLIFVNLLNFTLFIPVGKIIEERKNLIDGDYTKASTFSNNAKATLENYSAQIKQARKEAQSIIEKVVAESQKTKQEKISEVISGLQKEKDEAIKKVKQEEQTSLTELENKIKSISELITNKVLGMENSLVGTR